MFETAKRMEMLPFSGIRVMMEKATQMQKKGEDVIHMEIGRPDFDTPQVIKDAAYDSIRRGNVFYTSNYGTPELRKAIAEKLKRDNDVDYTADEILVTIGVGEGTYAAVAAFLNPGDEVIVIAPYFPEYRVWIETSGATCVEVLADPATFQVDVAAVAAAVTERTKAVVINSPNNPVGSVYSRGNLETLAAALHDAEKRLGTTIYLVADEPYREITYGAEVPWVPGVYDRTIVCYSYSKSLSLPGERIGWVLVPPTNPEHDDLVLAVAGAGRKLGFVCAPALFQRVLVDCVDCPSDVDAYAENRRALTEGLSRLGYEFIEPEGAFYLWVKALEPDANAFFERARALELLPVPSDSFGCPGWVRVGYCVSHETIVNSMPAWEKLAASYR